MANFWRFAFTGHGHVGEIAALVRVFLSGHDEYLADVVCGLEVGVGQADETRDGGVWMRSKSNDT